MNVIVAKHSGFCKGVQHAVDTAMSIEPDNVFVLGELIHNPTVTQAVERRGIRTVQDICDVPDGATLILRSHGVGKQVYEQCAEKGIRVIDCTCPFVKHTQEIVRTASENGKTVVVIGEKTHPEVIGICGWCGGEAVVVDDTTDDFSALRDKNLAIVVQTTYSEEKFDKIIKNIEKICQKTVEIFKTICYTTKERQREAAEIAEQCDAMLVIGGLNSSNTNKLYELC